LQFLDYTLIGILLKQEQDNGVNNMTNQKNRDKDQSKNRERSSKDRRIQNEDTDDLERPPDLERRIAPDRRTEAEDE